MFKFRLNRKDAIVYFDEGEGKITPVGHHLDAVILWHSKPFLAQMFDSKPQNWVQLAVAVVAEEMIELGHFVLNSGSTNALADWNNYLAWVAEQERSLDSLVTRFGFEPADVFYDYHFQPFDAPMLVRRVQQWRDNNPGLQMVDENLDPNVVMRLKREYRLSQNINNHVGVII